MNPTEPNPIAIEPDASALDCPTCGVEVSASSRFCTGCGAMLTFKKDKSRAAANHAIHYAGHWPAVKSCVIFYFLYLLSVLPLAWLAEENRTTGEFLVEGLDILLIIGAAVFMRVRLKSLLKIDWDVLQYSLIGIVLLIPCLLVNFGFHGLLENYFATESPSMVEQYENAGYSPWLGVFTICLMPAIWEEIAFRGLIQTQLQRAVGTKEAVFLAAALFAIIHLNIISGAYLFLLGLVLGFLCQKSRSLLPGMVLHFFHNFIVILNDLAA